MIIAQFMIPYRYSQSDIRNQILPTTDVKNYFK